MADETTAEAVDVKAYYEQRADKECEYLRVYSAVPMREGETWTANVSGLNIRQSADEDGYKIKAYEGMQSAHETFIPADEFKAKAEDASKFHLPQAPEELSAQDLAAMTPIKKGKQFVAGGFISARAECDGFLYKTEKNGNSFLSNYAVTAAFNYAGQKQETDGAQIVRLKDEPNLKGIILDEDVTFAFKSGPYKAEKGSFVMPNPDDVDGYTAYPPGFATYGLRRNQTDEEIAAISNVKLDNAIEVKGPLHLKRKPS